MSYLEAAIERHYEAYMEQEREWWDLCDKMVWEGWVFGKLNKYLTREEQNEIYEWLSTHFPNRFEVHHDEVLLPTTEDLSLFLLKWQ